MSAGNVLLAAVAMGLFAVLVKALRQNRALLRQVRAGERPVPQLLRDALALWSPLAGVIVAAVLCAHWATDAAVGLAYRLTTIDEFCRVEGVAGDIVIPCTGMAGQLQRADLRRAGIDAELGEHVSARFRDARVALMRMPADQLRAAAADRAAFRQRFSPRHLLALPRAPEDDPELLRLQAELRRLLATPPAAASDPMDLLRFAVARDRYATRLREVTAQVRSPRREDMEEAYANLPPEQLGRLRLAHRVSHALAAIPTRLDDGTEAALARLRAHDGDEATELARARRGMASLLARNEAATTERLLREARTPHGAGTLMVALALPRRCTVATADTDVRALATDLAAGRGATLPVNAGTFACFAFPGDDTTLALSSLGFRESVFRSIDRWHAQALEDSARRLGALARGTIATHDAAQALATAIPRGIDLGRSECGLLHPSGCVANVARQAAEESLAESFAKVAGPVGEGATTTADLAGDLDVRIGEALATLDARMERMLLAAHAEAADLFFTADLLRVLGWLTLALVVLKSFLYVLALEVFHHEGTLTFGLEADGAVEGEVSAARQLTIDRDFPRALITRKQLSNSHHDLRIAPWPWSAPLARILRGRYFLFTRGTFLADAESAAEGGQATRGMVASASGGMAIVEWKMRPGEEVVFGYREFFGASENIRLRSEISLRLSTLLLGRLVFRSARCEDGEGRLLLRAHVEEIDPQHIRAIPPERLLAWHRHARFGIHSGRTVWSTLLNGYTLVRKRGADGADGQVVVSSEDLGSSLGTLRFVRRIFSALF
jgi:hypothetical protein